MNGIAPDMIVYFGDLRWRSAGTVGGGSLHLRENDTGPDDANHAPEGVLVWDPGAGRTLRADDCYQIYDMAPSIMTFFGLDVPGAMIGHSLL